MKTLDELLIDAIVKDAELKKKLMGRIAGVLDNMDFEHILADSIEGTISDIFERDEIYDMVEDAIKQEIKQAISSHFGSK